MSKLVEYMNFCHYEVPETMSALVLSNVGIDHLMLENMEVPECGTHELLARVDACVACASDNKLIDQGSEHPLMYGWNVSKHPIIIGHEGTVTIVKVGKQLKNRYKPGQRFAVQPAVPSGPQGYKDRYRDNAEGISKIAVGYTLPGLFAEYVLIPEEVIKTGCLLPYDAQKVPFFGAALAEPISDVIAAQERIVHILKSSPSAPRQAVIGPRRGGTTLIVGAGPMGLIHIEVALSYKPSKIIISELLDERRERAKKLFNDKARQMRIQMVFTHPDSLDKVLEEETGGKGVDDAIVALGITKVQEESLKYLAHGGVACFFGGTKYSERMIQIDTHRIHYDGVMAVGSSGSDPSDVARALKMIAEDLIEPGNYVVKCGGLDAAASLIQAVRNQEIDGKGVIYPHIKSGLIDVEGWNLKKERAFLDENLVTV